MPPSGIARRPSLLGRRRAKCGAGLGVVMKVIPAVARQVAQRALVKPKRCRADLRAALFAMRPLAPASVPGLPPVARPWGADLRQEKGDDTDAFAISLFQITSTSHFAALHDFTRHPGFVPPPALHVFDFPQREQSIPQHPAEHHVFIVQPVSWRAC